jgi:hypothetical protein
MWLVLSIARLCFSLDWKMAQTRGELNGNNIDNIIAKNVIIADE